MQRAMTETQFTALLTAILLHEMRGEMSEPHKQSISYAVDRAEQIQEEIRCRKMKQLAKERQARDE